MRSVLVDLARERQAERRGGRAPHLALTTGLGEQLAAHAEPELVRVHEALEALVQIEPRLAQVVELRYCGGLNNEEIAATLGVGLHTPSATGNAPVRTCTPRCRRAEGGDGGDGGDGPPTRRVGAAAAPPGHRTRPARVRAPAAFNAKNQEGPAWPAPHPNALPKGAKEPMRRTLTRSPSPCLPRPSSHRRTPSWSCPCRRVRCPGRRNPPPWTAC